MTAVVAPMMEARMTGGLPPTPLSHANQRVLGMQQPFLRTERNNPVTIDVEKNYKIPIDLDQNSSAILESSTSDSSRICSPVPIVPPKTLSNGVARVPHDSTRSGVLGTIERYLESKFAILQRRSTVAKEMQSGLVLFCTCAYIFIMNPNVLQIASIDKGYSYVTTILVTVLGTATAGIWCDLPLIIAPAMGLNTLMAVEFVETKHMPVPLALGASLLSGCFLLALARSGMILSLIRNTPTCLKKSIIVSLGLFQAVIGMKNLGLIQPTSGSGAAGVSAVGNDLVTPETIVAICTILFTMMSVAYGIEGALLYGICLGSVMAKLLGAGDGHEKDVHDSQYTWLLGALRLSDPDSTFGATWLSLGGAALTITLVAFVDAGGVLLGLASHDASLRDTAGMMLHSDKVFATVGFTNIFSALIGCSPAVILLESAAGISTGARTGLASLTAVVLFLMCLVFKGFVALVPPPVGHAVLIIVGSFMMGAVSGIAWDNITEAFPSYATIIATVFTCSLANGCVTGFSVYLILNIPAWLQSLREQGHSKRSALPIEEAEKVALHTEADRRISISDWTQMGISNRLEFANRRLKNPRDEFRRTMSSPDTLLSV